MAMIKWTLLLVFLAVMLCSYADASSDNDDDSVDLREREGNILTAILSVSVFLVMVSILGFCGWCFKGGFKPFDERVLTDEQVVGNSYIDIGDFSTLNVDSLSADAVHQVAVDPLPSVQIQEARRNTNTSLSLSTVSGSLSHLQIPRTQLNYVAEIGSGWFGKVMTGEAMKLQAGLKKTKVIIKQLKDDASFEEKTQFLLEAQPYRELKHVNILPMVGQCTDSMPYLVVLDFCAFGDLKGFLLRRRSEASVLSQSGLLIRIACDIANGLEYMHRANMIHNDFAARSCLVAADMTVKIGDYGISQHRYKNDYYTSCHDIKMAIRWMAPETLDCQGDWVALRQPSLTKPANVWSFGVTLWELLSFGRRPYETLPDSAVLEKVFVEQSLKLQQPTLDIAFAERWYEIMQFCWLQYEQRPIMAELCALLKHLHHQTSALDQQTESFDEKWNSICPKKSPSSTVNMNATTSPVVTPSFESSFAPNTTNNNIPSKVQIPNNSMKVNSELAREFPRTSTPAAPVESRLNELPRTSTPAAPVESRLNELPRTSTPAAPVESRLNELPRTSTPAAPTESRLSDNRTSSSAMTNTSSSMYFSLNSTPTGNESGSDVFLTPRTSSRSPEEGAKAPKDAKISLSDVPPPASPPSDVDQSRSSAFSESSTMSLTFDDSSQSIDTTQLEIAVLDVGSSTDNQSKPINQANNDSQIEIKADVHMDSNIQALLSDSFDLDDSIADNLTFTDPATSDNVNQVPGDAITKEMISSSVLESPKGKTVITMQMPEDKDNLVTLDSGPQQATIVESIHQAPIQQNVTQVILEASDEDSASNTGNSELSNKISNEVHGTNVTTMSLSMGDSDITVAMMHADDDASNTVSTTGEVLRRANQGGRGNRTFQIIELDSATDREHIVSTDTTPLVKTTETESSSSRSESYSDIVVAAQEEEKVTLSPSGSPTFDKQGGEYNAESFTVEEKHETDTSVSGSDSEEETNQQTSNHQMNTNDIPSDDNDELEL